MQRLLFTIAIIPVLFINNLLATDTVSFRVDAKQYSYFTYNKPTAPNQLLVMFAGGNGDASGIDAQTDIPEVAEQNKTLTIGISIENSFKPTAEFDKIQQCILHALEANKIAWNKVFLCGFSAGGEVTLRYTQEMIRTKQKQFVPRGIFVVDPPLDYLEFLKYCDREINRTCHSSGSKLGKAEATWIKNYMLDSIGDPIKDRAKYVAMSPITISEPDFGNGKYLLNMPIRLYHEIDVMWQIKERCRTLKDDNLAESTELVNYLHLQGNKFAEIKLSLDKGYRADGRKHPHSWSIVDANELMIWMEKIIAMTSVMHK